MTEEIEYWECTECGYDKNESGGLPPPHICPLCAGDTGHDGNIVVRYIKKEGPPA